MHDGRVLELSRVVVRQEVQGHDGEPAERVDHRHGEDGFGDFPSGVQHRHLSSVASGASGPQSASDFGVK